VVIKYRQQVLSNSETSSATSHIFISFHVGVGIDTYMYRWEVLVLELVCAVTVNGVDGTFAQPWEHHPCPVGSSNHLFLKYKGVGVVCVFGMVSSFDKI
jgi:hypothetical protein